MKSYPSLDILLADDDPADVELARSAMQRAGLDHSIHVCWDGVEVLDYLSACDRGECPPPRLLLLDLNMPRLNGIETTRRIRQQKRWLNLPVVMFSTSTLETDLRDAFCAGVTSYIAKDASLEKFTQTLKQVLQYWLHLCQIPPHTAARKCD